MTLTELETFYVSASYVAKFYGVHRVEVYRALKDGRLKAARVRGNVNYTYIFDVRELPSEWPRNGGA